MDPRLPAVNLVRNSSGALAAPAVLAHRRGRQALTQRVKPRRNYSKTYPKIFEISQ